MNLSAHLKNKKGHASRQAGFTLIELLVVIGILAILLAITLIAINPARQFSQANNTQRSSDVNAILNAINQYMSDNGGTPPPGITSPMAPTNIASVGGVDICTSLVTTYLASMPVDPGPLGSWTSCGTYSTAYYVSRSGTDNRITVTATETELGIPNITVTR